MSTCGIRVLFLFLVSLHKCSCESRNVFLFLVSLQMCSFESCIMCLFLVSLQMCSFESRIVCLFLVSLHVITFTLYVLISQMLLICKDHFFRTYMELIRCLAKLKNSSPGSNWS